MIEDVLWEGECVSSNIIGPDTTYQCRIKLGIPGTKVEGFFPNLGGWHPVADPRMLAECYRKAFEEKIPALAGHTFQIK